MNTSSPKNKFRLSGGLEAWTGMGESMGMCLGLPMSDAGIGGVS